MTFIGKYIQSYPGLRYIFFAKAGPGTFDFAVSWTSGTDSISSKKEVTREELHEQGKSKPSYLTRRQSNNRKGTGPLQVDPSHRQESYQLFAFEFCAQPQTQ
jgi:hypothetical protein